MGRPHLAISLLVILAACSGLPPEPPAPPSLWFDAEQYVTPEYLSSTPTAICGAAPNERVGWIQFRAPLPDGSWVQILAASDSVLPEPSVSLTRGWMERGGVRAVHLDPHEGLVRELVGTEPRFHGFRSRVAEWLQIVGNDVLALNCAQ